MSSRWPGRWVVGLDLSNLCVSRGRPSALPLPLGSSCLHSLKQQNFEGINYGDRKLRDQMRSGFIDIGRRERKPATVKAYAPPPPRVGKACHVSRVPSCLGCVPRGFCAPRVGFFFSCFNPAVAVAEGVLPPKRFPRKLALLRRLIDDRTHLYLGNMITW